MPAPIRWEATLACRRVQADQGYPFGLVQAALVEIEFIERVEHRQDARPQVMGLPQQPFGVVEITGQPRLDSFLQAGIDVFGYVAERHPAIGYFEFDRTHVETSWPAWSISANTIIFLWV